MNPPNTASARLTPTPADAIRVLAMDAVQHANSGHPGAPMGMADMAYALWTRHLRHDPAQPDWLDRDRFVLSNGHGSMLVYALLHLSGYDLSVDELRRFRQLHSRTPGHPEVGVTPGVETTTGPLGQGLANAVGMALAEALLAAQFNRPGHTVVDHRTYAFVGDGCLMEGVSHEVCSLAGTLGLGKLVVLYDDNGISIDGEVKHWFGDDTAARFASYGWRVIRDVNGHDVDAVDAALGEARARADRPTLIVCRTVIGQGAPNMAGTHAVHGAPLGKDEIAATRAALGWRAAPFEIPAEIYAAWDARARGAAQRGEWARGFAAYAQAWPAEAAELRRRMQGDLPADFAARWQAVVAATAAKQQTVATRKASQFAITAAAELLPELLGGSADLTGSNYTDWPGVEPVRAGTPPSPPAHTPASRNATGAQPGARQCLASAPAFAPPAGEGSNPSGSATSAQGSIGLGRHINYGVREFGMAAVMNGVALHGGYLPFGGTFLTFSDYSRNAIRMAALMKQRVVHVFTHDSIGLGEDGPTHQSIEHATSLRLIPNLDVWRPCDTVETAVAWGAALARPASLGMAVRDGGPTALLLSRQNLPFVERDAATLAAVARGGYVLSDAPEHTPARAVIIATGSEVALALAAQKQLLAAGVPVRVVSLPCTSVFDAQPPAWRDQVLPKGLPRVAVEAGCTAFWYKYVGLDGAVVGIDRYGESAPAEALFAHFGLTAERVAASVQQVLSSN